MPPFSSRDLREFLAADEQLAALRVEVAPHLAGDAGHDLAHAERVAVWTIRLGGGEIDRREAVAAALCHDLVQVPKNSPQRAQASTLSADETRRLLPRFGFSEDAVERIADAVRDHSFSRGAVPSAPLGRALQDADRLEALGTIGIMRCIATGVKMGTEFFDGADPWARSRERDDKQFSIDHFFTKLLRLPATMQTEAGREEAQRRARSLIRFLEDLARELSAPMPILIVDYDPEWPLRFAYLKALLQPAMPEGVRSIEHVGSTSIPGLAAKPVIDVDIVVESEGVLSDVRDALEGLGYEHRGDLGIPGRIAYREPADIGFRHNLYVCVHDSEALENHLRLRRFLLANPDSVQEYAELKRRLAYEESLGISDYCEAKSDFIADCLLNSGMDAAAVEAIRNANRADK
ncbi:GrpB family protein [bacterium]|nr:GrpB family protein [bacterium]